MAVPALADRSPQPRALPLREVRTRLTQLVSLAELTDTVTLVTRDGDPRPLAAIVPASAARTGTQARADAERVAAISAGWARRLEELHRQSSRRHAAEHLWRLCSVGSNAHRSPRARDRWSACTQAGLSG
ncbi:hypothetical protein AB0F93_31525, partial [Micromonospora tulbaghiae]|uniref:hypothetical protein n=1 Tax=Micromonospora tulbaghiae TaxID=479978 RepID=UPI0033CACF63